MTTSTPDQRERNGALVGTGRVLVVDDSGFASVLEPDPERPSGRRLFSLLLLTLVLGLAFGQIAYFGSSIFDAKYRARAEVQYRGSAWTETQNIAVQSRSLTAPVAQRFDIPIKEFEEKLEAGLVPGTQVLRFDYISTDRELARSIVGAMATDYINAIIELPSPQSEAVLRGQLEDLEDQMAEAQADLRRLAREDSDEARIQQQTTQSLISSLRARTGDLELRLLDTELRSLDQEANGLPEVITDPFVFEDPVFPRPLLFGAIGFIVGCLIGGLLLMFAWNRVAWNSLGLPGRSSVKSS